MACPPARFDASISSIIVLYNPSLKGPPLPSFLTLIPLLRSFPRICYCWSETRVLDPNCVISPAAQPRPKMLAENRPHIQQGTVLQSTPIVPDMNLSSTLRRTAQVVHHIRPSTTINQASIVPAVARNLAIMSGTSTPLTGTSTPNPEVSNDMRKLKILMLHGKKYVFQVFSILFPSFPLVLFTL